MALRSVLRFSISDLLLKNSVSVSNLPCVHLPPLCAYLPPYKGGIEGFAQRACGVQPPPNPLLCKEGENRASARWSFF